MNKRESALDHRWGMRVACRLVAEMRTHAGWHVNGVLENASISGGFVRCDAHLPLYTPLVLTLPDMRPVHAFVARDTQFGLGLEWRESDQELVARWLASSASDAPSGAIVKRSRAASTLLAFPDRGPAPQKP